jgi:magnesium-transporting ATPase (P-type)
MCYIETKNLDGETNLKNKIANKDLLKMFDFKTITTNNDYVILL